MTGILTLRLRDGVKLVVVTAVPTRPKTKCGVPSSSTDATDWSAWTPAISPSRANRASNR